MSDIGIGALGYLGYAPETTEGTAVPPTKFLAVNTFGMDPTNDYLTPMQIRGARDNVVAMPAAYSVSGQMDLALPVADIANLLKSAFAATVNTSAYTGGGYTHVFTPGNSSPTFTFEAGWPTNALIMRYAGVRVNTFGLKGAFGEIVNASIGLDGIDRQKYVGAPATPSYHAMSASPLHFNGALVNIGGVANANVTDFDFQVNNNVQHIGTLRRTRTFKRVALGAREVTLSLSIDFQDGAELDRLLNDQEFAVELDLFGPTGVGSGGTSNTRLYLQMPRVRYKAVGLPLNAGDFVKQDFTCTVLKPVASDILTATLVNTQDGTVAFA